MKSKEQINPIIKKQYRYPGVKPFTENEQHIFFGRKTDTDKLFKLISLEKLVLLYSKSGLGKSSLLNAGVIPRFKDETELQALTVRLGAKTENSLSPVQTMLAKLPEASPNKILAKLNVTQDSLWLRMKALQETDGASNNSYVLFLDQFEELFTYSKDEILEFKTQLSDLLYVKIPSDIRKSLSQKLKEDEQFFNDQELEYLYRQPEVKVVLSIRSDRMSQLNQLTDYLPDVLKNYYELGSLDEKSAIDAITRPARRKSDLFISPTFRFVELTIKKIIDYLTDNGEKNIETFQLQTVCQFAENMAIENQLQFDAESQQLRVNPEDLGDLQNVFRSHYDNLILKLDNTKKQLAARLLIENELIIDGNRVSLPDVVVLKKENIDKELIVYLHDVHHIIRSEPNTTGGISYELSHDTLVAPILEAKKTREEKEEEARAKAEQKEALRIAEAKAEKERIEREKERKRQKQIIMIVSIAAVISIAFGIFGFMNMFKAESNFTKAIEFQILGKKKDAISFKNNEKFTAAIGKYNELLGIYKKFPQVEADTIAVYEDITECVTLDSLNRIFTIAMDKSDSLITNKDLESIKASYAFFKEADNLNYRFAKVRSDKYLIKFEQNYATLKAQAKNAIAAGGIGRIIAQEILVFLAEVDEEDKEVVELLKKLKN